MTLPDDALLTHAEALEYASLPLTDPDPMTEGGAAAIRAREFARVAGWLAPWQFDEATNGRR